LEGEVFDSSESMRKDIITVDEDTTVTEASAKMRKKGQGCVVIIKQGKPFGMMMKEMSLGR